MEQTAFLDKIGDACGAVVTFSGLARAHDAQGRRIRSLFLQHHPRLTQASLSAIAGDGASRFDIDAINVIHRAGTIMPGETIVWVAAASRHRRTAFEAVDYVIDRLKTDSLFWKREDRADGISWIEPTDADRQDRMRWER